MTSALFFLIDKLKTNSTLNTQPSTLKTQHLKGVI
jgi:hypothetical protein